ncbi:MAG: metallophosphoesterase [bacterium]|nr:metallophosphoesterase [bacterium]
MRRWWNAISMCAAMATVVCVLATASAQAETARGVVFNDKNGNGLRDRGESGVKNVCVSNGRDVVKTDRKGRYALTVGDDTILHVIKPTGWMTPVDGDNVPRFYYVHKPKGSRDSKYAGVAPTGALPASVDFPLVKQKEPKQFEVILFGDTQTRNAREVQYLAHDFAEDLTGTDAAFGVTLGDVVFNDLSVFDPLVPVLGRIGVPWYGVIGNHDMNLDSPDDADSDETWARVYGPPYYAFNYGGVHFVSLDSPCWTGKGYHAELGTEQTAFVQNDLAMVPEDRLVVLLMHIPVMEFKDKAALFEILKDRPHTFSISAHWHTHAHFFLGTDHGWQGAKPHHHLNQGAVCGGWWSGVRDEYGVPHATMNDGTPNGYTVVTFDGNRYSTEYRVARRPASHQMAIYAPETVASAELTAAEVIVNVFNGSERSTVEMRVGDTGDWIPLTRVSRKDPYYVMMHDLDTKLPKEAGLRVPEPKNSAHIWTGTLAAGTPKGTHLVQVRTTDMSGHAYEANRTVVVQ